MLGIFFFCLLFIIIIETTSLENQINYHYLINPVSTRNTFFKINIFIQRDIYVKYLTAVDLKWHFCKRNIFDVPYTRINFFQKKCAAWILSDSDFIEPHIQFSRKSLILWTYLRSPAKISKNMILPHKQIALNRVKDIYGLSRLRKQTLQINTTKR